MKPESKIRTRTVRKRAVRPTFDRVEAHQLVVLLEEQTRRLRTRYPEGSNSVVDELVESYRVIATKVREARDPVTEVA